MAPFLDFDDLTTPHIADACLRLGVPVRAAPMGICVPLPAQPGYHLAGRDPWPRRR